MNAAKLDHQRERVLGALLAVYWHRGETNRRHRTFLLRLGIFIGVPLILYFHFDKRFPGVRYNEALPTLRRPGGFINPTAAG